MLSVPVTLWLLSTCVVEGVEKRGKRSYRKEVEAIHRADIYCNLQLFVLWRRMFNLGARILYTLLLSLGSILRHLKNDVLICTLFPVLSVCLHVGALNDSYPFRTIRVHLHSVFVHTVLNTNRNSLYLHISSSG